MKNAFGTPQTVLVLGGRSEIAGAILRRLQAEAPLRMLLGVRDPEAAVDVVVDPRSSAETVAFDARATDTHDAFVSDAFARLGDVDLVLLAFGVLGRQERDEVEAARAVAVAEANFVGAVSVLVPVAQRLREQGHGTIVVLSSVAAERARRANFVYGAAKAGLDAFAQGLGDALHPHGVQVLVVRPGFVPTAMTAGRPLPPRPFRASPEEVANEVVRGLERGAHTVWVPPRLRFVMAALRLVPRPLFRLLRA